MKREAVFLVGGGTGGHLSPALAVANSLTAKNFSCRLITDLRCQKFLNKNENFPINIFNVKPIMGNIFKKLFALFFHFLAFIKSIRLIIKFKPKLVVGFGGYTMLPMLMAARVLRVPIFVHEQNSYLGRANRYFAKDAVKILLSFEKTENIPLQFLPKVTFVGNAVRQNFKDIADNRQIDSKIFNIVVFGGSQGANYFSTLMPNVIKIIKELMPELQINIIQQCNEKEVKKLKRAYQRLNVKCILGSYFNNLDEYLQSANIAIARAGASTIFEFIAAEQPAILIPYPHAAENHQYYNALHLYNNRAGWYYNQSSVTPSIIAEHLVKLVQRPSLLDRVQRNLKRLRNNNIDNLAATVENFIAE